MNLTYVDLDYSSGYAGSTTNSNDTTLLISNLLLGIVAGVITGMCLCCMCVCLMYSKHKKNVASQMGFVPRRRIRLSQRARDLVAALRDRDPPVAPPTPPPPNYTLVSGLPSYDEALKEARKQIESDENHDYVIWIEKVEKKRKISEEQQHPVVPTVFHIFENSPEERRMDIPEEENSNNHDDVVDSVVIHAQDTTNHI